MHFFDAYQYLPALGLLSKRQCSIDFFSLIFLSRLRAQQAIMNAVKMQRFKPKTLTETVLYWLQNSSIDGLGHAGRARSSVSQVMWMVLVVVGISGTVYNIYYVLYDYFLYEVRASILLSTSAKVRKVLRSTVEMGSFCLF